MYDSGGVDGCAPSGSHATPSLTVFQLQYKQSYGQTSAWEKLLGSGRCDSLRNISPGNEGLGKFGARKRHGHRLDVAAASTIGRISHGYGPLQPVSLPAGGAASMAHHQGFFPSVHLLRQVKERAVADLSTTTRLYKAVVTCQREAFNAFWFRSPGSINGRCMRWVSATHARHPRATSTASSMHIAAPTSCKVLSRLKRLHGAAAKEVQGFSAREQSTVRGRCQRSGLCSADLAATSCGATSAQKIAIFKTTIDVRIFFLRAGVRTE